MYIGPILFFFSIFCGNLHSSLFATGPLLGISGDATLVLCDFWVGGILLVGKIIPVDQSLRNIVNLPTAVSWVATESNIIV